MTPDEFRAIRTGLGLNQTQLATVLGYGARERITEIETGRRPVTFHLALVMTALADGWRPRDWPFHDPAS